MSWPTSADYNEAIQNLRSTGGDDELRAGQAAFSPLGLPMLWTGNFADVYKIHCPETGNTWALKCFTREVPGLRDRYREISAHLERVRLPFTVDFQYLERGIRVGSDWCPALKMRWVEGFTLNQFVQDHLQRRKMLKQLLQLWVKLSTRLRQAEIAHADLQHGNVLLVPMPRGQLALKLIDYDGMYVPSLAGTPSHELGHPAYQHPQRLREGTYNLELDRFSHLAIYCGIHCLLVGRKPLWQRFNNGDNLLFRETDFRNPGASEVFRVLCGLQDTPARALAGRLMLACQMPLEQVPLLDDILTHGAVHPLTRHEETTVEQVISAEEPPILAELVAEESAIKRPWWASAPRPLPGTEPAGTAGTLAEASSVAIPEPMQERAGLLEFGLTALRHVARPSWTALRWGDRLLAAVAGEGNTIMHGFLRIVAFVLLILLIGLTAKGALSLVGDMINLLAASRTSVEEPTQPPAFAEPPPIARQKVITNSIGMKLVLIPAGQFLMGSRDSDTQADSDEKPQHRVRITKPFYLGMYEVTQAEYERVMGTNPSRFKDDAQRPAERVLWDEATEFCRRLSEQEGKTYRLPTEAEWEYACRAGSTTKYSFGDNDALLGNYAWFSGNSGRTTHPVGQKSPNAWGLHDMHGNVWEWCQDRYDSGYYKNSPTVDPRGPASGSSGVSRGGSWYSAAGRCQSANRTGGAPASRYDSLGFRLASVPVDVAGQGMRVEVPKPLRINPISPQTAEAGTPLVVPISVENAAFWQEKVTYGLGPRASLGASIDPQTGTFTWTPNEQQAPGTYDVTVTVRGPSGQQDQQTFGITVTKPRPKTTWGDAEITLDLGGGVTLDMVLIPAGSFTMGDDGGYGDEKPPHRVTITKPFYLGKYEVTQEQWEGVMGSNPSRFKGPNNPVENVSWDDCQAFLKKVNEKSAGTGRQFSLPSEAQWEYACRAGSTTQYSFGDDDGFLGDYAWFFWNSGGTTHPAGQKSPNTWGLHDMHGNVWEWCQDRYDDNYYTESPTDDPTGPASGSNRVLRGSGWGDGAWGCRSALRGRSAPGFRGDLGFRLASVPVDASSGPMDTSAPARYEVTLDPPEADIAVTGKGATIEGTGGARTITVTEPDGQAKVSVVAALSGYERLEQELQPKPGESGRVDLRLKRLPSSVTDQNVITNSIGMKLVLIPAGEFLMGSPDSDTQADSDEKPQHRVRITKPFYLGMYEVTQAEYDQVMGTNPSRFKGDAQRPAERVSWDEATEFCRRLSQQDGKTYRLPTEAEWEYACRAGSTTKWCFGNSESALGDYAWHTYNSDGTTHPVGQKRPNAWGLYDMHGNVREWCADWYDPQYYGGSPLNDPGGPSSGGNRVVRGGCWGDVAGVCRSSFRLRNPPSDRVDYIGFRLVCSILAARTR